MAFQDIDLWLRPDGPIDISLGQEPENAGLPKAGKFELPEIIPILPVKDLSLFPRMVLPMLVDQGRHSALIDEAVSGDRVMGLLALKGDVSAEQITSLDELYQVGVAALVLRMAKVEGEGIRLVAQGVTRFKVLELVETEPFIKARVEAVEEKASDDMEAAALISNLRALFRKALQLAPHLPEELQSLAASVSDPGALCDMVAGTLNISPQQRQSIVEAIDIKQRLKKITDFINHEIKVMELGSKIQSQVKEGLDKSQREYYLRQQLKAIQKELGEGEESANPEVDEIRRKLAEKKLPEEVRKEAGREVERLAQMHSSSSEYHVITTYLDWILSLPWLEPSKDSLDIPKARQILEADHYGLDKVKRRILEYLSVRKLNPGAKGPILCFAGPPGVGKTSLGRSIARSMGREFVRISLGGVRDEAEIRGHRRTYVGALPGRIIQSIRRAGTQNPVFMLDEMDKVGNDFRGDPSSALLEVLDPEQNFSFSDHYLDLPFDLSKVMFIATANRLDTIPPPLRDRMEIIELSGYTAEDKLKIAKRFLVPRQRKEHGLSAKQAKLSDAAIKLLIKSYTREAGLRNLEREIGSLYRFVAGQIAEGKTESVSIGAGKVKEILGPERFAFDSKLRTSVPGVATGLAWTPVGGDILFIEASSMPGKGRLTLTGQLGDVMKESAQAAVSFVRANAEKLGVDPEFHEKLDLHIHIPAGAIPKDGPSAGVTLITALMSLLSGEAVNPTTAMTGEITLRGMVLPVGGIKEKVLAAHRAGIKKVLLPEPNQRDLEEVPENVKNSMEFVFLNRMDQVCEHAMGRTKKQRKTSRAKPATKAK
jgi:ATP-dependent Lon protease